MLKIQFDRPDAAGRCPIHLRAYFDGQRLRVATRKKRLITEWNADKGRFKKPFPGLMEANEYLETLAERMHARYRQLRSARGCGNNERLRGNIPQAFICQQGHLPPLSLSVVPLCSPRDHTAKLSVIL